jgi:regulator of PEP synthase PpsR (kinase-PPPase family)
MASSMNQPNGVDQPTVVILSGGSGRTAETVVEATLAQFDHEDVRWTHRASIRDAKAAVEAVREAAKEGAILCHTLVDPKIRNAVVREAQRHPLPVVDVLGPALVAMEDYLGRKPKGVPGLSYELNKEQFDRIEAVDFTLAHDDGARLHELDRADAVLVGVSRVAKSVTCFYLAYRGIRAANVPIVAGLPIPSELVRLDARKVIGLTMNAQRLGAIRTARTPHLSVVPVEHYVDAGKVAEELRYARQVMSEHGWRSIDVSYMAVEEVAVEVIRLLDEQSAS